jgi:hypothetical protein
VFLDFTVSADVSRGLPVAGRARLKESRVGMKEEADVSDLSDLLDRNVLLELILGLSIQDAMSGFFGMRDSVLQKIKALEMDGCEIYLELFAKAKRRGLKIEEYPEKFVHKTASG